MPQPPQVVMESELGPFLSAIQKENLERNAERLKAADTTHYGRGKRAREVGEVLTYVIHDVKVLPFVPSLSLCLQAGNKNVVNEIKCGTFLSRASPH